MRRRGLLATALVSAAGPALAQRGERVEVWRDPNCGCCSGWVAHLRTSGFAVEPLWDDLFPAERARIVRLLVDRVDVRVDGAAVRLRLDGLGSLVRDLAAQGPEAGRAAA